MEFKMKNKKGYTLVEVLVAIFIFVMIMSSAVYFFTSSIFSYKNTKAVQQDLQNAQYAMNLIAKTLRTSSLSGETVSMFKQIRPNLRMFDYSQNKCIEYRINFASSGKITSASASPGALVTDYVDWCKTAVLGQQQTMTTGYVEGMFMSTASGVAPGPVNIVGISTIYLKVCPQSGCTGNPNDEVHIQSSLSLRDFTESGI
jgi:prepilin-type N-terminal cleavage/methylation domain-containing protein